MPDAHVDSRSDASATRRLNILFLGWMIGTGSSGVFIKELADFLSGKGHSVTCFSAGRCDWRIHPYLAVTQQVPFEIVELRNPPIMVGARSDDPNEDVISPVTVSLLRQVLARVRPDIVAVVDFPGWPAKTVEVCHQENCRVLVFLHNFWPFCSRLSLLSSRGTICYDFQNGARCVECTNDMIGSSASRWRNRLPKMIWKYANVHSSLKKLYQVASRSARTVSQRANGSAYSRRRKAYAEAISAADLLIGISNRTLQLAHEFGVHDVRSIHLPITFVDQERLRQTRPLRARLENGPVGPIRFAYIGAVVPEKGVEVLISAFQGVQPQSAKLDIYGFVSSSYLKVLQRLADPNNPPVFHGRYDRRDLSAILAEIDVGIVPSHCEDTRPNTVIEFQAAGIPVIGSRIGGIPEQIIEMRNGLLVEPGNVESLRSAIEDVVAKPDLILSWRTNLPSDFRPVVCWTAFESACYDILK